jgi:histidinol phosphatase-like enzyme (inositol monophosphatase family)
MDPRELGSILELSIEVAQLAGKCTLGYFGRSPTVTVKQDGSPVTDADRSAEQLIRERIARVFPDHGIVGEEFGEKKSPSPGRWILDPIDGTHSFICGVPLYAVLVAFEWQGEVLSGVIHLPALRETVWAARGLGCYHDGRRARVSDVDSLGQARVVHAGAQLMEHSGRGREFARLIAACGPDRGWSDAYGHALVATGRAEVALDPVMKIWDVAALVPILAEAGGTLTDWKGRATHTAPEALATNGKLLGPVLEVLEG